MRNVGRLAAARRTSSATSAGGSSTATLPAAPRAAKRAGAAAPPVVGLPLPFSVLEQVRNATDGAPRDGRLGRECAEIGDEHAVGLVGTEGVPDRPVDPILATGGSRRRRRANAAGKRVDVPRRGRRCIFAEGRPRPVEHGELDVVRERPTNRADASSPAAAAGRLPEGAETGRNPAARVAVHRAGLSPRVPSPGPAKSSPSSVEVGPRRRAGGWRRGVSRCAPGRRHEQRSLYFASSP